MPRIHIIRSGMPVHLTNEIENNRCQEQRTKKSRDWVSSSLIVSDSPSCVHSVELVITRASLILLIFLDLGYRLRAKKKKHSGIAATSNTRTCAITRTARVITVLDLGQTHQAAVNWERKERAGGRKQHLTCNLPTPLPVLTSTYWLKIPLATLRCMVRRRKAKGFPENVPFLVPSDRRHCVGP